MSNRAKWLVVGLVMLVMLAMTAAGVGFTYLVTHAVTTQLGSDELPPVTYDGDPGVPGQELLADVGADPEVGWRIDLAAALPGVERPRVQDYVGSVGDRAYFTVDASGRGNWVLAVDPATGTLPYPPIALDGSGHTTCYVNGTTRLLCLESVQSQDRDVTLFDGYVIDTDAGAIIADGPTDFSPFDSAAPHYQLQQVGSYVVATQRDNGAYGVGDHGELTWEVAGDGLTMYELDEKRYPGDPPTNVAVVSDAGIYRAFSAVDGKVLVETDESIRPFVGGFVADVEDGFDFYDDRGTKVGHYAPPRRSGASLSSATQLPSLGFRHARSMVLDPRGVPIAVVEIDSLHDSRIVGDHLFALRDGNAYSDAAKAVWDRIDLRTGRHTTCMGLPLGMLNYVGSDGTVMVGTLRDDGIEEQMVAVDAETCDTLWAIDDAPPTWAVGSTLVQSRPDDHALVSLTFD